MPKKKLHVIVGLGTTGLSCAKYLARKKIPFAINDTRPNPPQLTEIKNRFPNVVVSVGKFDDTLLDSADVLVVSPGLPLATHSLTRQVKRGIPVIGDIELFANAVKAPVIAITGTNAKSTVTTLVGLMAGKSGLFPGIGGNLGFPALDLLTKPHPGLFVLELSSFQLETTFSLAPKVATVLNVTEDHMDRYADLAAYQAAKQRIYQNCEVMVFNRDDPRTNSDEVGEHWKLAFTLQKPGRNEFGLLHVNGQDHLAFQDKALMPVVDLPILGRHYQANALAALALGYGYGMSMDTMLQTLAEFKGLPHRCQLVREKNGVRWYNDSKGTNVGATLAAIEGLGAVISGKLIMIMGGIGKNADFTPLVPTLKKYVKAVVLIGEAALVLAEIFGKQVEVSFAKDMEEAVIRSNQLSESGDSVLLSPACASMDMFKNFEHRGEVFEQAVQRL
jgi:UDP-N-acetylmuramoylalanine--D-glutamate ligase